MGSKILEEFSPRFLLPGEMESNSTKNGLVKNHQLVEVIFWYFRVAWKPANVMGGFFLGEVESVGFSTWVFPKIGVPQNGWFIKWKTLLKWMIWGYHYFWKHPYVLSTWGVAESSIR